MADRCGFWFGTEDYMDWFPTPLQGADASPTAWGADGTLLTGGGWALNSWGSHKRYIYEWPSFSSREVAQKMKSYRDGTFGRGLLYFIDPLIYDMNILPAQWAAPHMAIGSEAPPLVRGSTPTAVATSGWQQMGLPVTSALYTGFTDTPPAPGVAPDPGNSLFVPIPDGYTLHLGAYYSATGSAGVIATEIDYSGNAGAWTVLTPQANNSTAMFTSTFTGIKGIRLSVGRYAVGAATVTLAGMIGRLAKNGAPAPGENRWVGGMGHSGARFLGTPSYIANSGVNGGQIGFAASFAEVGSWLV